MNSSQGRSRARDTADRENSIRRELALRAGVLYRLGFSAAKATARLTANVEWDYEVGGHGRPSWLNANEIGSIVQTTYARRPS